MRPRARRVSPVAQGQARAPHLPSETTGAEAMTLQELNIRIATAGGLPSQANNAVKALIDSGVLTLEQAMPILVPLRLLTPALISIQEWHDAQEPAATAKPALPPGMAVADVAGADDPVGH